MSSYIPESITLQERQICTFREGNILEHFYRTTKNGKILPMRVHKGKESKKVLPFNTNCSLQLRNYQIPVAEEAESMLLKDSSCLLNLSTGFGKCFSPTTLVRMADGTKKQMFQIKEGDYVLNSFGRGSRVANICFGISKMCRVNLRSGMSFIVTEDHPIPVFTNIGFDIKQPYDSLGDFCYFCIFPTEYSKVTKPLVDPYIFGRECNVNSRIPKDILKSSLFDRLRCIKGLEDNKRLKKPVTDRLFMSVTKLARSVGMFVKRNLEFIKSIETDQIISVVPENSGIYFGFELEGICKTFVLASGHIAHNTCISIYLASRLKLKPLVITASATVQNQWRKKFKELTGEDVEVYGVQKALNMIETDNAVFVNIGTCIVDEVHMHTKSLFKVLNYVYPKYLIGLSATLEREDGLNRVYPLYFGNSIVSRFFTKCFTVHCVKTEVEPIFETRRGKLDWNSVITSLTENTHRLSIIVKWIKKFEGKKILVVCKRVKEATAIASCVEDSELYIGSKKNYRKGCNVLVSTTKKVGVGFDDSDREVLVLTTSVKDVRQLEGRIRRDNFTIVDFLDKGGVFWNHWKERREWYIKRGGKILYEKNKTFDTAEEK